ncbi:hypothetical protein BH18ACT8_BH18ACT8_04000 [soil metagenome]
MTIHSEHPFLPSDDERDPVRRLRGRLGVAATLWTSGEPDDATGLTVSSMLVATGQPGRVLGLLDPEAHVVDTIAATGRFVVNVLAWSHRPLAEAFAGMTPAPGGPFRMAHWESSDWGPVLIGAVAWAGCRVDDDPREVGWSLLLRAAVERVEIGSDADPLLVRRGRYLTV